MSRYLDTGGRSDVHFIVTHPLPSSQRCEPRLGNKSPPGPPGVVKPAASTRGPRNFYCDSLKPPEFESGFTCASGFFIQLVELSMFP